MQHCQHLIARVDHVEHMKSPPSKTNAVRAIVSVTAALHKCTAAAKAGYSDHLRTQHDERATTGPISCAEKQGR